jgi:hypothetical protein
VTKPSLKVVDASSPERAELAAAIATHSALSEQLAGAVAADDWQKRAELRQKVEQASKAVDTAKADAVQHLTDQALGKTGVAPQSIKEARAALQDAEDQLEVAEMLGSSLQTRARELRQEVLYAKHRLDEARMKVVGNSAEVGSLFAQFKATQRKLAGQRKLLKLLDQHGMAPEHLDVLHNPDDADDTTAALAEWQAAIDTLARDAGAPLPKI